MAQSITKADVWSVELSDRPGELAWKLKALSDAGVNLSFLMARRQPDKPGLGIAYVSGLKGPKQQKAATGAGFSKSAGISALRVEAPDKPGACTRICRALADARINLRGLTAAPIGKKYVSFLAFDSAADAAAAAKIIKKVS